MAIAAFSGPDAEGLYVVFGSLKAVFHSKKVLILASSLGQFAFGRPFLAGHRVGRRISRERLSTEDIRMDVIGT
jgi:hypothetical protein